jgi:hypothetical protein
MFAQPAISASANHNVERQPQSLPSYQQELRIFDLSVELLIARATIGHFWVAGFNDAAALLASLPLPTSDFAAANRHLQNASAYCKQKEVGAATFELRSLRGYGQRL